MPTLETRGMTINTRDFASLIGRDVTDSITGVRGRVIGTTLTDSGVESVMVQQPRTDLEGYPCHPIWLDRNTLEDHGNMPHTKRHELLGHEVFDRVTGYTGTIVAFTFLADQCKVHIQGRNLTNKGIPAPAFICDLYSVEPGNGMKSAHNASESGRNERAA